MQRQFKKVLSGILALLIVASSFNTVQGFKSLYVYAAEQETEIGEALFTFG